MQLRLTRRAIKDLGLNVEQYCRQQANDYSNVHDVVAAFVGLRQQDPEGQEWTNLPVTKARVFNLHCGRYRGLTWHDEEADVVWLLGAGWHESGSRDDAYEVLKRRDSAGTLMPGQDDYLDLEMTFAQTLSFATQVYEQAPILLENARRNPGVEAKDLIAGRLFVGVVVTVVVIPPEEESLEEIWVSFQLPPHPGDCELPPQEEWLAVVLAALLPENASFDGLEYGGNFPGHKDTTTNEIVVCWRSF